MTAEGRALRIISEAIENYHMCSSDMEMPIETLIDTLQTVNRFRPDTSITVGAIRRVLLDINDTVVDDATRWVEQTEDTKPI